MDDRTRGFIATGCNSEGRPCGKCPRVTVKTEHSYLRLRPQGKLKEVRGMRDREERKKNRRASSLSFFSTSNISPSRTCLTSTSCFLFVLVDLDSPQHCRSTLPLSSVPLVMTSPSMFHILNFCLFISHTFSPITKAILNKQSILFFSYLVYEKKLHTNYSEEKHLVVGMKSKENRMNFVRLLSQEVYF